MDMLVDFKMISSGIELFNKFLTISVKMYPLSRTNLTIYEEGILLLPVFNGYSFVVIYL